MNGLELQASISIMKGFFFLILLGITALAADEADKPGIVKVTLNSDGATFVEITNAGMPFRILGKFKTQTISLLPGIYEVHGRRKNFKDVEEVVKISRGSDPIKISVMCTDFSQLEQRKKDP